MRRIHIKRNRRGLLGVGILVLVICFVLGYNTSVMNAKVNSKQEQVTALEKNKKELQQKQEELKDSLTLTDEDIERIAREKLNLVYPDDKIFKSDK